MKPKLIPVLALASFAPVADAGILIQELFDNISTGNASLNGAGSTTSTVGLSGTWATNSSTGIFTANNFNVNGSTLPGLPSSGGANGGVWNNTGSYNTSIYATRPLATSIDFATDRVIYFSVRLANPGDTSMGIGLASGSSTASQFVGAGFSWNNAVPLGSGSNVAGNAAFISHGVLDNTVQNGVYGIRAYESGNPVNTFGLLVGRITIKANGDDEIHIKRYAQNAVIDSDLAGITWTASSTVNSSMLASHLLLWMNGSGSGELDAIRFGDTWADVTGVTPTGISSASVASVTGNSAQASADLVSGQADVTLHWDTVDQGTGTWTNSNPLGTKTAGPVTGEIAGLTPDTTYFYRFHAVNADPVLNSWSESGRSFTTSLAGLSVTDLIALPLGALEVDLSWSEFFATETGFIIQRSPAGAGTWTTVGTAPANSTSYTDRYSGLTPNTAYDYRVLAASGAGNSDPSNVFSATTLEATPMEPSLLIKFDGTLDGTQYTPAEDEVDVTGSFQANGTPSLSGGLATINPGNESGPDGFNINPANLGDLRTQNWVAEVLVTYQSTGNLTTTPVVMDVQGDTNLRLRSATDANVLQMFYWNGSASQQQFTALPPTGVKVHLAYAWNASTATLTGYVNGVAFGSTTAGPFTTPSPSTLSFGYFARPGFVGRGIDGVLDAVSFQTGTTAFNPSTGFLILPPQGNTYATWIGGYPTGGLNGFNQDADHDGLSNGVEALMGTNPSVANGGGATQVTTDGTVTTFQQALAIPALGDVSGSFQWSPDLITWYAGDGVEGPVGGPTVTIPFPTSAPGGMAAVTATSSSPLQKYFIRAKATK